MVHKRYSARAPFGDSVSVKLKIHHPGIFSAADSPAGTRAYFTTINNLATAISFWGDGLGFDLYPVLFQYYRVSGVAFKYQVFDRDTAANITPYHMWAYAYEGPSAVQTAEVIPERRWAYWRTIPTPSGGSTAMLKGYFSTLKVAGPDRTVANDNTWVGGCLDTSPWYTAPIDTVNWAHGISKLITSSSWTIAPIYYMEVVYYVKFWGARVAPTAD